MSNTKKDNRLSFLRWKLNPSAAALWQLASKQAFQDLDVRASWIEIESHWNPSVPFESEKMGSLQKSISESRPIAVIIGIERASLTRIVGNVCKIRELCHRLYFETNASYETATSRVVLIGWFPEADRESMLILRELGFDLVLHNPSTLRSTLTKFAHSRLERYDSRLTAWATPRASYFKFQISNTKFQPEQSRPDGHAVKPGLFTTRCVSEGHG